jgi:FemAB-related protein (PEP-CTERM system-associated)
MLMKLDIRLTRSDSSPSSHQDLEIRVHGPAALPDRLPVLAAYAKGKGPGLLSLDPRWLLVLQQGLGHKPYCLEAVEGGATRGLLPLSYIRSLLFGRFLVSLPYVNYGGVLADDDHTAELLIGRAAALAQEWKVRYLELRHEYLIKHPSLTGRMCDKLHMRRPLPKTPGELWDALDGKVRNQVRKGQKNGLTVNWGRHELLPEFHGIFSRNMRDLGTPTYGRRLFRSVLEQFGDRAELCVVRGDGKALAAALLLHGEGMTEVPSASSLRQYNSTNANMLMYWHLLERAVQRKQSHFDFGRCSPDSSTYHFKKQWGAVPSLAEWQYHVLRGSGEEMRTANPKYQRLIRWWKRMPLWLTRLLGPLIVRGIP